MKTMKQVKDMKKNERSSSCSSAPSRSSCVMTAVFRSLQRTPIRGPTLGSPPAAAPVCRGGRARGSRSAALSVGACHSLPEPRDELRRPGVEKSILPILEATGPPERLQEQAGLTLRRPSSVAEAFDSPFRWAGAAKNDGKPTRLRETKNEAVERIALRPIAARLRPHPKRVGPDDADRHQNKKPGARVSHRTIVARTDVSS